jgi:F-type H+-transporting ATPase subunit gamma
MAKTRALVKRRKAIRNIRKITRTMELIATARFKRAMDRAMEAEAYTRRITELVRDLSAGAAEHRHPLLEAREPVSRGLLLVLTSNRGLCGGYNANVLRQAVERYQEWAGGLESTRLEVSGKRGVSYLRFRRIKPDEVFTHFEDRPRFEEVDVIAERYIQAYATGEIDRLDVAYTCCFSVSRQVAVVETLLPMRPAEPSEAKPEAQPTQSSANGHARQHHYEFLPDAEDILREVLPMAFKVRLFKCFLDAAVSEQISRMIAMKGATENADKMIRTITMLYNRARQAEITKQIAEIVGGAEALK